MSSLLGKGDNRILLGFQVGTGSPVLMKLHHLVITGMTGESGKTTTIEALLSRGKLTALVFRTKRGELGFDSAIKVRPFFSEEGLTEWRALEGLLSATLNEKVQREPGVRAAIIGLCSGAKSLDEIYQRNKKLLTAAKGFMRDVREKIKAYLDLVLPQLNNLRLSNTLELQRGRINVMDLEGLSDELQNLIIFGSTMRIYNEESGIVLVVPEAPKFIPQDRGSPCKVAFERYIREGRAVDNWLWIDSQDLRGVDKRYLRHCDNWIMGRQRFILEVESVLDAIPLAKAQKPKPEEIQRLDIGQFFACLHNDVTKVYVQPAWLEDESAARTAAIQGTIAKIGVARPVEPKPDEGWQVGTHAHGYRNKTEGEQDQEVYVDPLARSEPEPAPTAETRTVELTDVKTTYKLIHKEHQLTMSTASKDGQVLYVMIHDFEGSPRSTAEIASAMTERTWPVTAEQVRLVMLRLVKDRGLVVKDGTNYRLAKYAKINVELQP